jgi:DNA adenine methylase
MVNIDEWRDVPNTQQPPAAWIGGKRSLAPRLVKMIAEVPHSIHAEPFVGMGGVFFRRTRVPRCEVINDRNGDVVNLFRILQRHYPQFMDTLKFQITSRREFERLKASCHSHGPRTRCTVHLPAEAGFRRQGCRAELRRGYHRPRAI